MRKIIYLLLVMITISGCSEGNSTDKLLPDRGDITLNSTLPITKEVKPFISPAFTSLEPGQKSLFSLTLIDSHGVKTNIGLNSDTSWVLSDPSVGTYDSQKGELSIKSDMQLVGKNIELSATYKGNSTTAYIHIVAPLTTSKITSLKITPSSITGYEGDSAP
jgi:hypothetical protein